MGNKVKIVAVLTAFHGSKMNLPIDGEVEINGEGILEVSEECANLVVNQTSDYKFLEEKQADSDDDTSKTDSTTKEVKTDDSKPKKDGKKTDKAAKKEITTEEETGVTKADLEKLELSDLISILKEKGVDEASYKKFVENKALLISFILKNVK